MCVILKAPHRRFAVRGFFCVQDLMLSMYHIFVLNWDYVVQVYGTFGVMYHIFVLN